MPPTSEEKLDLDMTAAATAATEEESSNFASSKATQPSFASWHL